MYIWRVFQEKNATRLDPICHFVAHNTYLTRLLISPDVRALATCSADHTVKIWKIEQDSEDLLSDEYRDRLEAEEAQSNPADSSNASLSTNGVTSSSSYVTNRSTLSSNSYTANSNGNTAGVPSQPIQNIQRPLELLTTLEGHQRWVWDCAFSADSAYLVTVCSDHYARLWELSSTQIIRQYNGHHRGAVCVALNDHSEGGTT